MYILNRVGETLQSCLHLSVVKEVICQFLHCLEPKKQESGVVWRTCALIRLWSFSLPLSDLIVHSLLRKREIERERERTIVAFIDPAIKHLFAFPSRLLSPLSFSSNCLFITAAPSLCLCLSFLFLSLRDKLRHRAGKKIRQWWR